MSGKSAIVLAACLAALAGAAAAFGQKPVIAADGGVAFPRVRLLAPPEGVYVAAFPGLGGSEDQVTAAKITDFEKLVGRKVAWTYFSNNWYDGVKFPRKDVDAIYSTGSVPFIRLMARSRGARGGGDPVYTMDGIISGKFDDALRQWARDARDVERPLLAEFGTEVNGSWFPWNGQWHGGGKADGYGDPKVPDGPERFRDAYRHIIDICRAWGARNIVWFLHVDADRSPEEPWNTMAAYYPGDDYIDWIGISVYGSQRRGREWVTFVDKLDRAYDEFAKISATKPLAILEYGVVDDPKSGSKAEWMRQALDAVRNGRYPRIKAVSYWDEAWGEGDRRVDLRVNSSPEALEAYKKAVADPFFVSKLEFTVVPGTPADSPSAR